jgi:hypothetical protein
MRRKAMEARFKRESRIVILLFLGLAMSGSLLWAHEDSTPRDEEEARKWMEQSLHEGGVKDITIENGVVNGRVGDKPFRINLMLISTDDLKYGNSDVEVSWYEFPHIADSPGRVVWRYGWAVAQARRNGERFRAALNFLGAKALADWQAMAAAKFEEFKPKAVAWRQMAVKPEMMEEARRHKVLAEDAFHSKDVGKAIFEYSAALQLDPCWPEGHYNLAMLAGEIGSCLGYLIAAHQMKEYLELMPDAADSRAAKDIIIIWEDRAK